MADNIQELNFSVTDPTLPSIGPIKSVRNWRVDVKKTGSDAGSYVLYETSFGSGNPPILRNDKVQSGTDANGNPQYIWRTSVVSSYQSTYNNLSEDQKRFLIETMAKNSDAQRAKFINASYTQDQKNNLFPNISGVRNTAPPSQFVTTGGSTGTAPPPPPTDPKNIQSLPISGEVSSNEIRRNYGADKDLAYPLDRSDNQDYIKFTMFKYDGRELGGEGGITKDNITTFKPGKRRLSILKGSVTLPIQPSITDSNGVEWGGPNLSGPDAYLASLALGGMNSREGLTGMLSDLMGRVQQDLKTIADTSDFKNAIKLYLAQEAVGTQGLLSRATGAIINPNLELLFTGPTLRPFNFTFRLSPRSEKEANNVKRIIRFFKQGMSVKTAPSNIFLKAPNLFDISYIGKSSTSLNKIKTCALLSCEVDYTPDGTYMTFSDGTMTSYQITLRFSEVDPIYEENYTGLSETEIGY
jgi:hypothetical protein